MEKAIQRDKERCERGGRIKKESEREKEKDGNCSNNGQIDKLGERHRQRHRVRESEGEMAEVKKTSRH